MDMRYAFDMAATIMLIREGTLKFDPAMFETKAAEQRKISAKDSGQNKEGRVAIIPIHGTMFMEDQYCGPRGMRTIGSWIQQADAASDIDAILLDIYSPGGQVDYTETLGNIVAGTKKPIVAYANQLTASAAYWVGSHADRIFASGRTAEIGSIGVLVSYMDVTRMFKELGVDLQIIRSSLSPEKAKFNFAQPSEDDIKLIQQEWLDPVAQIFHDTVRDQREGIDESVFTGNTYYAEEAIELGLVDEIGSIEDAAAYALDMAFEGKDNHFFTTSKTNSMDLQAKVTELEQQLAESRLANKAVVAERDAIQAAFEARLAENTELKTQIAAKDAQIKQLENETPPAPPAPPAAPTSASHLDGIDPKFITDVDRALAAQLRRNK